jgi:hypothetical protein
MGDEENPLTRRLLPPPTPPNPPVGGGAEDDKNKNIGTERKKRAKRIIFWFSVLTLGSGYILYICLRLLLYEMAKQDILVTMRSDGEIKAIMRGNECIRYIMKVENHQIDPDGFDIFKGSFESYAAYLAKALKEKMEDPGFKEKKLRIKYGKPVNEFGEPITLDNDGNPTHGHYQLNEELENAINEANSSTVFEEVFGVFWVGLPPYRVFSYPFRWLKYGQQKAGDDGKPSKEVGILARDEPVNSLFFRYPQYGVVIDDAETGAGSLGVGATAKDGKKVLTKVKIEATFVFETITTNPQKTLFRTAALSSAGDWQQALVREISDRGRMWLGATNWDTLVGEKEIVQDALRDIRDSINGVDENGTPLLVEDRVIKDSGETQNTDKKKPRTHQISAVRDYGQRIVKITMPKVDLKGIGLQESYEQVFKAEKKRDADIALAAGQRAIAAAPIQGKADGLKLIGEIPGGKEMYMAEQLGKIGVYAPGRDNMFLNVAAEATGKPIPPTKKTKGSDSSDNDKK